jgi:uncharacterized protein
MMVPVPQPPPQCWLHPDVAVGPSDIAGRGLFTVADLPAGTVVSRLGGTLVGAPELGRLLATSTTSVDSLVVDDGVHLVLAPGSDNRFANHACDPNLGWVDAFSLATLVDVPTGAELLHDYAMSIVDPDFVLRCHCQSYRCRQMVEGTDWRIPQLQRRYAGHRTPYVQGLIDAQGG